ncbi:NAD(P)-binding protein [Cristinia sonorae]|uniref:NAD(P)-binding protein n=1 Tax=Cristinia sonorae TaxID=1940300 RepID=A0A8K0US33_9AGAR|nr:NAD(P)-binding protein [Cristinia sonorae]
MPSVVTIIGGHGKIALLLASRLANASKKTYSVIRTQDHAQDITNVSATPVVLSLEDDPASKFTDLFEQNHSDVVVFSAGAGGKGGPERTKKVDYEGALKIFDAIEAVKGPKPSLILVSAIDSRDSTVTPEHYSPKDMEISKSIHEGSLKNYYHWKYEADKNLVNRTGFPWTILAPGLLLDDAAQGTARIGKTGLEGGKITREDVAIALAELVDQPKAAGLVLNIISGTTPIKEAVEAAIENRETAWVG